MNKISALLLLTLLYCVRSYSQNFDWANVIEGFEGSARAHQIVTDNNGDVIILGTFIQKIKLEGGSSPVVFINPNGSSYFLAKYDAGGTLYWAKHFDTGLLPTFDNHVGLEVNNGNDIFVAAPFSSDITIEGTTYPVGGGGISSFIAKFDPDGNIFGGFPIHVTGPTLTVALRDIEVNSANEFFVLGNFNGDLDLGGGVTTTSVGSQDIFVAKYDNTGAALSLNLIASAEYEEAAALELDGALGFYVAGMFRGPLTFPSVPVNITLTPNSNTDDDFFVAHYNGTIFSWARKGTGIGNNFVRDMHVNTALNGVYITGSFNDQMDIGSLTVTALGSSTQEDIFALKLFASNGVESWLVRGGGTSSDRGYGITESGGTVFIVGRARSNASIGGLPISSGFTTVNNTFVAALDQSDGAVSDAYSVNSDLESSIAYDVAISGTVNFIAGEYDDTIVATPERWSTATRDFFVLATNNTDLSVNDLWGSYYYSLNVYNSDTDDSGNTFIIGSFRGYFEEYLASTYVGQGNDDIFIARYDNNGNKVWIDFGGGPDRDVASSVVVNQTQDVVYLAGTFEEAIDIAGDAFVGNTSADVFLAKYDFNGPLWGLHAVNSTGNIAVNDVATDDAGNIIITGNKSAASADFNGVIVDNGAAAYYLAKYDPGGTPVWVRNATVKSGEAVTTDTSNDIIITGLFDFATTFEGQAITPNTSDEDVFTAKYLSDGTFQWIRTGGGNEDENVFDVKTDQNNAIYVTGWFFDDADFDGETLTGLNDDVFLIKYDPFGNIQWARSGGGTSRDEPSKLIIDGSDNVILSGHTIGNAAFDCFVSGGLHFDDQEIFIIKYNSGGDLLFGTHFGFISSCDECNNSDRPYGIGMDASGNFYLVGRLSGPATLGSIDLALQSLTTNYFITRFTLPAGAPCSGPDPLIVTNTNDSGVGSLRWVLDNTNVLPGENTVVFDIPASDPNYNSADESWLIIPSTPLPTITEGVVIDATTQPGSGIRRIVVSGDNSISLFSVNIPDGNDVEFIGMKIIEAYSPSAGAALSITAAGSSDNQIGIIDCLFENNQSDTDGGAIALLTPVTLFIDDSDFNYNTATDNGGAIAGFGDGIIGPTRTNFVGNLANVGSGGAIFNGLSHSFSINACAFVNNTSGDNGGALTIGDSSHSIENTTFSQNIASNNGGAIYTDGLFSGISVIHSTFFENVAYQGGGVYVENGVVNFENTVLSNPADGDYEVGSGTINSDGHNFVSLDPSGLFTNTGDQAGSGTPIDPLLSGLDLNGGTTYSHNPLPGSPLIDAGTNIFFITTDQRGLARPQGVEVDIGSIEFTDEPNMVVYNNSGTQLFNNQTTEIDFGTETVGTDIVQTFTIENNGTTDLSIIDFTFSAAEFSLFSSPSSTIAPGNSEPFSIVLSGATAGSFSGLVTIESNDSDESFFSFPVTGTIVASVCALLPTVDAGSDLLICPTNTATLSAVLGGSATIATWTTNGSGTFDDNTSPTAVYTPSAADESNGAVN